MIAGIALIFLLQGLGELIVWFLDWPIPGPIVGMILLLITLLIRGSVPVGVDWVARRLLPHLTLFLLPVSVGIFYQWEILREDGVAIGIALLISLVIAFVTTVVLMRWLNPATVETSSDGGDQQGVAGERQR